MPSALGPVFMICAPTLVFDRSDGVVSRFHVLRSRTRFRRHRGRRFLFSYFALPESFSAVPRASDPVFMFCAPGLVFYCTECVGSHFHVLRSQTHFRRYRGRRFPFSCFALPDSFLVMPIASGPIFMFCAPGIIFGGTEAVRSGFHVLRSRTRCRRCRVRQVSFSCFARLNYFSVVPRASVTVFIFSGADCVKSRFHVLRIRTYFRRYRGRLFSFSCFALPNSFSAVPRASDPFFMFFVPGLDFYDTADVGSRFQLLRSRTHFRRY
jgi:hypothetical protein